MKSTTQVTLTGYYEGIRQKNGWQDFVSENIAFNGTGVKATRGKEAYIAGTDQFLRAVTNSQIKEMIVEDEKACTLMHYELMSPKGKRASSDVAEIMTVRNGKIIASLIYFDTAAFGRFMADE